MCCFRKQLITQQTNRGQRISHDLSEVYFAYDIYDKDGGMSDHDISQEHSISSISDLPVYYNQSSCCYRDSYSSALPASQSLQDINNNVEVMKYCHVVFLVSLA